MPFIPSIVLRKLYDRGSLRNTHRGVAFSLKNRLGPVTIRAVDLVQVDGHALPLDQVVVQTPHGPVGLDQITPEEPLELSLGDRIQLQLGTEPLREGEHQLELAFDTAPYGRFRFKVEDGLNTGEDDLDRIPRSFEDDFEPGIVGRRQDFLRSRCRNDLRHVTGYSFEPREAARNIEHFTGVAQVPLGFAGPLLVDGEHAQGEFYVPLATSEGTLVASYNRGMKVLRASGGARCTVVGDNMQRAPVFIFRDARGSRRFADWINSRVDEIRKAAEATSHVVRLKHIDYYLSNTFAFLRFNYTTGDAGGQNMVSKATFAACNWILDNYLDEPIEEFYMESNFATDKKSSMINIMRTRGKRVTAEVTVERDTLWRLLRATPERLHHHNCVANVGAFLSGANNNGLHAANAITAMFIATGQDVANVAEASAGIVYTEVTEAGELRLSITLPGLIVATYGGGTGLPTQRECLEAMGCYGKGKVRKLAEIVAATVLAGELSLAAAISSMEWVSAHERMGRHR